MCVLSPILFSIYTNEIISNTTTLTLIKFAGDMALVARLKDEQSLSSYFNFIGHLISWFDESYLKLNLKKTIELFIDKHRARNASILQAVRIKTEDVESVKTFKYLETVLDNNLSFTTHVDTVRKKVNQRMYLIRKLKSFDVDKKMLEMIYRSLVESILTFNIVSFYGDLTVKQKNRLNKIVNIATKLINFKQKSLNDLYQQAISKNDPTHPLHSCYEIMLSGKRYRTPVFKRQLYNKSVIPSAVRFMMSSTHVIYLLLNYNFQAISTKIIHFDVSINLLRSIYFPDFSLFRLNKFYHQSAIYVCKIFCIHYMYLLRDMPIVMCIYLIQIYTFLLLNVLKREISNVFLYIWTIDYSYSYPY